MGDYNYSMYVLLLVFHVTLYGMQPVIDWQGILCVSASAHPQSLGLHLEVGLQLVWGEIPHCSHRVLVILSHPAALTEQYVEKESVKEKEWPEKSQDGY